MKKILAAALFFSTSVQAQILIGNSVSDSAQKSVYFISADGSKIAVTASGLYSTAFNSTTAFGKTVSGINDQSSYFIGNANNMVNRASDNLTMRGGINLEDIGSQPTQLSIPGNAYIDSFLRLINSYMPVEETQNSSKFLFMTTCGTTESIKFSASDKDLAVDQNIVWGDRTSNLNLTSILPYHVTAASLNLGSQNAIYLQQENPLINDSTGISFTAYGNISTPLYKGKDAVESFEFKDHVLKNDDEKLFALRTTNVTGTIFPDLSAAVGNGGTVIERAIYRTEWAGTGTLSYAVLTAPNENQAASFVLNPAGNFSGGNQHAYFGIRINDNIFSIGTSNDSEATIGFDLMSGTVLRLNAETIKTDANIMQDGCFQTTSLVVTYDSLTHTTRGNVIALFESDDANGTLLRISNGTFSQNAITGISLSQGGYINQMIAYPENSLGTAWGGSLVIETNSPRGLAFSIQGKHENDPGGVHFVFGKTESLTVTATRVSISTILELGGTTEAEMWNMKNPTPGTIINNTDRNKPMFSDGQGWFEFLLKPAKPSAKNM